MPQTTTPLQQHEKRLLVTSATPRAASSATSGNGQRSYRCTYTPLDRDGWPVGSDSGVLPHVRVQAANAEQARMAAYALIGCPICDVERVELA